MKTCISLSPHSARRGRLLSGVLGTLLVCGSAATAFAGSQTIDYANWTADSAGIVVGTLLGGTVNVTYTGEINFDQLNNNGTYYYTDPSQVPGTGTEYTSNPVIANTPSTSEMIAISGNGQVNTFTFSKPVTDLVMLFVSLGQPSINTTYTFDQNYTLLSDGPGWWGGPGILLQPQGNVVAGVEGDGAIEFVGTYTSISFTTSFGENWNGFTIGTPLEQSVPDAFSTFSPLLSGVGSLFALKRMRR